MGLLFLSLFLALLLICLLSTDDNNRSLLLGLKWIELLHKSFSISQHHPVGVDIFFLSFFLCEESCLS